MRIDALSQEGVKFLSDKVIYEALAAIASPLGVTPEEYLERFEMALSEKPEEIFSVFKKIKTGEIK